MPAKLQPPPDPHAERAETALRPAAPPAQREYAALRLFLSQDAGFRLALATFDRPATRDGLTARLVDDLAKSQILLSVLDLVAGEGSLLRRVQEHLTAQPTPPGWRRALAITNLEARLDPNKLPMRNRADADRDLTFLEEANLHRDAFPAAVPCPVLLWLTQLAETDFAKSAPDLWHWRNARFDFEREDFLLDDFRAHPAERIAWFEKIAAAARHLGDKRGEVWDLISLGNAKLETGEAREAVGHYEAALAKARELGDHRGEGGALGNLGIAHFFLGDARKAIELYEQQLKIVREIGDRRGEANALGNLGNAYFSLGDARKAIEFHEQALKDDRELGARRGEGQDLGNFGSAYLSLGNPRKAIELYEEQLKVVREIGDRREEGNALGNLGIAYFSLGDMRKAIELCEQQLKIVRGIGDRRGEGNALGNLGNAYLSSNDARKAIEFYQQRLKIAREIGDRRGEGHSLWNSALALYKLRDQAQAITRAEAASRILAAIEDPDAAKVRAKLAEWRGQASG